MFEVETVWIPHCVYTYISLNVVGCLRCALLNALLHMQFNYYDGKASHDQRWILRGASHGRLRDQQKEKKKKKKGADAISSEGKNALGRSEKFDLSRKAKEHMLT